MVSRWFIRSFKIVSTQWWRAWRRMRKAKWMRQWSIITSYKGVHSVGNVLKDLVRTCASCVSMVLLYCIVHGLATYFCGKLLLALILTFDDREEQEKQDKKNRKTNKTTGKGRQPVITAAEAANRQRTTPCHPYLLPHPKDRADLLLASCPPPKECSNQQLQMANSSS